MVVYHTTRKLYNVPSNQLQYKELVLTDWKKTFWTIPRPDVVLKRLTFYLDWVTVEMQNISITNYCPPPRKLC